MDPPRLIPRQAAISAISTRSGSGKTPVSAAHNVRAVVSQASTARAVLRAERGQPLQEPGLVVGTDVRMEVG